MIDLHRKIILAPLAGISDRVFRRLCRQAGADCVISEMVSADGLRFGSGNTEELMSLSEDERPVGIQLFGSDPAVMADAARIVVEKARPDFIDLNAGCPVRKVVGRNGGAALLKDDRLFERIVRAMADAISIPLTVKIRSGWNVDEWVDTEFARIAQENGAAAIAVHARSKTMGFSSHALWERIALVKRTVSIPVIGNGDIDSPLAAQTMFNETGCDTVMVGRAAMGAPWLFGQIQSFLRTGTYAPVTDAARLAFARNHLHMFIGEFGEKRAAKEMKKHIAWYTKGVPGASRVRDSIFRSDSAGSLTEIIDHLETLLDSNAQSGDGYHE